MSVLDKILARTREDLARREARLPLAQLREQAAPTDRSLAAALSAPGLGLIAEFKPASPSRGALRPGADPARYAAAYGRHAAAISVLCDEPFFGGGRHLLPIFRQGCPQPLLCKDFLVAPYQIVEARAAGADAVLLLASVHGVAQLRAMLAEARALRMDALVEAHDEAEIDHALEAGAAVVGVNARDLRTLQIDPERGLSLLARIPRGVIRVAESGVERPEQVAALRERADAVLIGSALMLADDPEEAIVRLGW